MAKKRHQEKSAAVGQYRATPFAALKGMDLSRKEPDAVPPPSRPLAHEVQPVEEDSELFLRAMAGVTVSRTQQSGRRGVDGKRADRPAPVEEGDSDLFLQAMAGVRSLGAPPGGADKGKTASSAAGRQARSSSPPDDDRESAELFLQEIGRLKLETKFVDSPSADEELKPLSGNRLRQVRRGIISVSHQLDLHGLTREEALAALPRFLDAARHRGQKAALVITGKGINSPGEPVLQQAVASWLRDAGREMVLEFAPAPREMGGGGAYVVFLRPLPQSPAAA
ncbi:Smr/MutS family protein [Geobacter sp. AOG2]|uniref:Smr/MutS family protein n=1 Tax=Geobacter sp. AOG2 TaxID=1566347 RepID=UPI001CC5514B|nr:Smr/MutS family protein [Geobacter sp. AOG2]GFE62083.1 DNA mismatch repair protein MutS [Geobacter sp. AOG2]